MLESMSYISDPPVLGPTLKAKRAERSWTLDRLAAESGVSRSMLSEIERGDSNPTFATLWNITQAIGIEIHELMADAEDRTETDAIELTSPTLTPAMSADDGRVTLRALSPVQTADAVEWYQLSFDAGGALRSTPHIQGTIEHLTVLNGELEVRSGKHTKKVEAGATARYSGDVTHDITNTNAKRSASALLVVLGGRR